LPVPAAGFSQLRLRGMVSGPRLRLREVEGHADQVELASLETTRLFSDVFGVSLELNGALRLHALGALAAGSTVRWLPARGEYVDAQPLGVDVFEVDGSLASYALAQQVGTLLRAEFLRAPIQGTGAKARRTFPRAWAVWIEHGADAPFAARDQDGPLAAEHIRHVRVHMVPVEDP